MSAQIAMTGAGDASKNQTYTVNGTILSQPRFDYSTSFYIFVIQDDGFFVDGKYRWACAASTSPDVFMDSFVWQSIGYDTAAECTLAKLFANPFDYEWNGEATSNGVVAPVSVSAGLKCIAPGTTAAAGMFEISGIYDDRFKLDKLTGDHCIHWNDGESQWETRTGVTAEAGTLLYSESTDQDNPATSGWTAESGDAPAPTFTAHNWESRSLAIHPTGFFSQELTAVSDYNHFDGEAFRVMTSVNYTGGQAAWCGNNEGRITGAVDPLGGNSTWTVAFPVCGRNNAGRGTVSFYTTGTSRKDLRFEWVLSGTASVKCIGSDGATVSSTSPAQEPWAGHWSWLAFTKAGNVITCYVNGIAHGTVDVTGMDFTGIDAFVMGGTWNAGTESIDSDIQGGIGKLMVWRGEALSAASLRTIAMGGLISGADYVLDDLHAAGAIVPSVGTGNGAKVGTVDDLEAGPPGGTSTIKTADAAGVLGRAYVDPATPGNEAPFVRTYGMIHAGESGTVRLALRATLSDSALTNDFLDSVTSIGVKALCRRVDPDLTGTHNIAFYMDTADGLSGGNNIANFNAVNMGADFEWESIATVTSGDKIFPLTGKSAITYWFNNITPTQVDIQATYITLNYSGYEAIELNGDANGSSVPILKIRLTPTAAQNYKIGSSIRINKGGTSYVGSIVGVEIVEGAVDIFVGTPDSQWATLYDATAITSSIDVSSLAGGTVTIDEETDVSTTSIYGFTAGGSAAAQFAAVGIV